MASKWQCIPKVPCLIFYLSVYLISQRDRGTVQTGGINVLEKGKIILHSGNSTAHTLTWQEDSLLESIIFAEGSLWHVNWYIESAGSHIAS